MAADSRDPAETIKGGYETAVPLRRVGQTRQLYQNTASDRPGSSTGSSTRPFSSSERVRTPGQDPLRADSALSQHVPVKLGNTLPTTGSCIRLSTSHLASLRRGTAAAVGDSSTLWPGSSQTSCSSLRSEGLSTASFFGQRLCLGESLVAALSRQARSSELVSRPPPLEEAPPGLFIPE
ncbi:unnamed protein product, partial [Polarella glacialis]